MSCQVETERQLVITTAPSKNSFGLEVRFAGSFFPDNPIQCTLQRRIRRITAIDERERGSYRGLCTCKLWDARVMEKVKLIAK